LDNNEASKNKALRAIFLDRFNWDSEQPFIVEFLPPISRVKGKLEICVLLQSAVDTRW